MHLNFHFILIQNLDYFYTMLGIYITIEYSFTKSYVFFEHFVVVGFPYLDQTFGSLFLNISIIDVHTIYTILTI